MHAYVCALLLARARPTALRVRLALQVARPGLPALKFTAALHASAPDVSPAPVAIPVVHERELPAQPPCPARGLGRQRLARAARLRCRAAGGPPHADDAHARRGRAFPWHPRQQEWQLGRPRRHEAVRAFVRGLRDKQRERGAPGVRGRGHATEQGMWRICSCAVQIDWRMRPCGSLITLLYAVRQVLQLPAECVYRYAVVPVHHPRPWSAVDTRHPRLHIVPQRDSMGSQALVVEYLADRGLGGMVDCFGRIVSPPTYLTWPRPC